MFENLKDNKKSIFFISFIALIYILFPTKNYYWDGLFFSQTVEDANVLSAGLFHPNHLFYNVAGYLGYRFFEIINFPLRAIYVFQILSVAAGISSAAILLAILKKVTRSDYLSFALTAIFAFSATWWKFATDASAYIPSVFLLLVSFYLVLPNQLTRPLAVAAAHAGAMFFHELAVLFFPVAVLGIIYQTALRKGKERFLEVTKYAGSVFVITFGTFCGCYYLQKGTFEWKSFFRWITFYTDDSRVSTDAGNSLWLTLGGTQKLFFNGAAGFRAFEPLNFALLLIFAAAAIFFIYQFGRNFFELKICRKKFCAGKHYFEPTIWLCISWIAPYLLFLLYFIPENTFYRLFYLPGLIILAGTLLAPFEIRNSRRHWRLAAFAVVVGLSNFLFYIRPQSQIRANTPLSLASSANEVWTAKTVVYYDALGTDERIVKYFTPTVVWKPLTGISPENFEFDVGQTRRGGGNVWLESSAVEKLLQTPETNEMLAKNLSPNSKLELNGAAANLRFVEFTPPEK